MSEVDSVIVTVKLVGEGQSVVLFVRKAAIVPYLILEVADVSTRPVPTEVLRLGAVLAESEHTHSLVVETVWFCEVDDVEADLLVLLCVRYPKEVPLRVTVCVYIILKDQIVLI